MPDRPAAPRHRAIFVMLFVLACSIAFAASVSNTSAQRSGPQGPSSTYLPFARKSVPTATPPPPSGLRIELFTGGEKKTASGNIVIDSKGGWHMAYVDRVAIVDEPHAYYMYCAGPDVACKDGNNWKGISLRNEVFSVQLRLTSTGLPRLLVETNSSRQSLSRDFYYVACDGDCSTDPNAWYGTFIAFQYSNTISNTYADQLTKHSFALDPFDRPRFVYDDGNHFVEPDHYGAYYLWCDADCGEQANWNEGKISHSEQYNHDRLEFPSLAFTKDGRPRVVANMYPIGDFALSGLYYFECDANCESDANWKRIKLAERGSYVVPSWDLVLDSAGRPRIAFFKGQMLDSTGEKLYYLTCSGNCLNAGSWTTTDLGFGTGKGHSADLLLDKQDRPRLAYIDDGEENLDYAWCNAGCTSANNWRRTTVESNDEFLAKFEPPFPVTCDAALWDFKAPTLSLSPAGEPRATYDAGYHSRCYWDDPTDNQGPYWHFVEVYHTVRLIGFPQP